MSISMNDLFCAGCQFRLADYDARAEVEIERGKSVSADMGLCVMCRANPPHPITKITYTVQRKNPVRTHGKPGEDD